jgi:tetratricopeptide (TPR) repeat protein
MRGQSVYAAKMNVAKSVALYRKGLYEDAIPWGRKGLASARKSRDPVTIAYAHDMLGASYREWGNLKLAARYLRSAVALYQEAGNLSQKAVANNNLGACYQQQGHLDLAIKHYEISVEALERLGNQIAASIVHGNIGEVLLIQGHPDAAADRFNRLVETYKRLGDPAAAAGLAFVNLSRARMRQHNLGDAMENLRDGINLLSKIGAQGLLLEARVQEAELLLEMGEIQRAHQICRRRLAESRDMGMQLLEARGLRIMGKVESLKGDPVQAEDNLKRSLDLANTLEADPERAMTLCCLATLYARHPEIPGFRSRLGPTRREAVAVFRRLGVRGDLTEST